LAQAYLVHTAHMRRTIQVFLKEASIMSIAKCLILFLLLCTTTSIREQEQAIRDTKSETDINSAKSQLERAAAVETCPTELNPGDNLILSSCYKHTLFQQVCPTQEMNDFLADAGGHEANGGNSGSTISIGEHFMLKSVKKDEADRLVVAIQRAWGQGQSLLDPICRIFVETNRKTAWILGRTISLALEGKREVAAFDLKSPKFSRPDRYTVEAVRRCINDKTDSLLPVVCDPHDLKTLAYYQSYRAQCQGGQQLTKLQQLEQDRHLQDDMVPSAVQNEVQHSFSNNFDRASYERAIRAHAFGVLVPDAVVTFLGEKMVGFMEELVTPESITCDALSKKWAQKDVAFDKLVGTPFYCDDETGRALENRLATDAGLLAEQGLTDYSLFLKVYEYDHDDGALVNQIFPVTAKVDLKGFPKQYIIAMGIIDYGEEYTTLSEPLKFGTTTMLKPDRYEEYFNRIIAKAGYITYEGQPVM